MAFVFLLRVHRIAICLLDRRHLKNFNFRGPTFSEISAGRPLKIHDNCDFKFGEICGASRRILSVTDRSGAADFEPSKNLPVANHFIRNNQSLIWRFQLRILPRHGF